MSSLDQQFIDKYGEAEYRRVLAEATREAYANVASGKAAALRPALPDAARADVLSGELTVAQIFQAEAVPGKPGDYNLSEFTDAQRGNLAEFATDDGVSNPGGQAIVYEPPITQPNTYHPRGKAQLENYVKDDIKSGDVTVAQLLQWGILPGQAADYDLSEFTPTQIGELPIGQAQKIR